MSMSKKKKSVQSSSTQSTNQPSQPTRSRRANLDSTRDYAKLAQEMGLAKPPPPNEGVLPALASGESPQIFAPEVANILGFAPYQVPILVRMGGLNPMGFPARSAQKRFARAKIKAYAADPSWLDYFNALINLYWRLAKGRI